jgi:5-methylcytosine-specific restriction endonuclease McrA
MGVCETPLTSGKNKGLVVKGTNSGYKRHLYYGEQPCDACTKAHALDTKRRRDASPEWRERERKYQAGRKDKMHTQALRWRAENPERWKAIMDRFYANNPGYKKDWWEQYYAGSGREVSKAWRENNKDKIRAKNRRRRAALAGVLTIPFTADELDQRMSMWGFRCWICGGLFEAIDHVIPVSRNGPHALSNLRPACTSCNSSKHNKPYKSIPVLDRVRSLP